MNGTTMPLETQSRFTAKKVAIAALAIAAVGMMALSSGVFSTWLDTASFDNTIQAGTLDLAGSSSTVTNFPQAGEPMVPGDKGMRYFNLTNAGDVSFGSVSLLAAVGSVSDTTGPASSLGQVETGFTVDLSYCVAAYTHTSSTSATCAGLWGTIGSPLDLGSVELKTNSVDLGAPVLALLNSGANTGILVTITMDPDATPDLMGASFPVTWTVVGTQRAAENTK